MNKEKSKPAAAATVTDLEENAVASISEDIIADTGENVKTHENIVPEIVLIALTDKLEDEIQRLKESDTYIYELRCKLESEIGIRMIIREHVDDLRRYIIDLGYGDVLTVFDKEVAGV